MKKTEDEKSINIYTTQPTKIVNLNIPKFWQAVNIGWGLSWGVFMGIGSLFYIGKAIDWVVSLFR